MKAPHFLKAIHSSATVLKSAHSVLLDAGTVPEWVQVMPLGEFAGRDGRGPWRVSSEDAQAIVAATLARAAGADLPIDYDHQTDLAAVAGVGGTARASGWMKEFQVRDDGIWARVEWTQRGAQALEEREYRYISPVFHHTKDGKVIRILRAGLTNDPNLQLAALASATDNPEEPMDKVLEALLKALGLDDKADEATVMAALNAQVERANGYEAVAIAAGCKAEDKPDTVATAVKAIAASFGKVVEAAGCKPEDSVETVVTAISKAAGNPDPVKYVPAEALADLQKEVNELKAKGQDTAAETAVAAAIKDGTISPALKDWAVDLHKSNPEKFHAYVKTAPKLVEGGTKLGGKVPAGGEGLTAEELAVCQATGTSPEDFKKTKEA